MDVARKTLIEISSPKPKKMKKFLWLIIGVISISGCKKEEALFLQPQGTIFGFDNAEEARNNLGIYADVFTATNGWMYVRSTKQTGGEQAEIRGSFREEIGGPSQDGGRLEFGPIALEWEPSTASYELAGAPLTNAEKAALIAPLFGGLHPFRVVRDGKTIVEFVQYVPEKLDVQLQQAVQLEGAQKGIHRSNFEIRWNRDDNNTNGIVAYLFWKGDRTDNSPYDRQMIEVHRAIKLDDTGQAWIPSEFFDDIPPQAIVTLFFIRGNVQLAQAEGYSWKFYAITQDKQDLVLLD